MFLRESLLALSLSIAFITPALADCCDHCGCNCGCRKVCHLKCDVKKVTKVEYSCECEDFCVPGKSEKIGSGCECHSKQCLLSCREHCCEKPVYKPTCAAVHTKKKLIKHEVTKKVPSYKWVVETVCDHCAHRCLTCKTGESKQQVEAEAMARFENDAEPLGAASQHEPEGSTMSWWNNLVGKK
jgi:hypothetical protein